VFVENIAYLCGDFVAEFRMDFGFVVKIGFREFSDRSP
jgi:hypothetical protein